MEIVKGIYRVDGVNCNVYLVENGDKLTLIDTGLPRSDKKIVKAIKETGRNPQEVSTIVITHFHIDHVGSLKKMKELTGAKVAVHGADSEIVAGKKTPPKPKGMLMQAANVVLKPSPVEPDVVLKEGDVVEGLQVIHTPGHSEGSISLFDAERKVMFVGDAMRFTDGKIVGPPERYTLDTAVGNESIKNLANYDFDVMLAGHGETLMPEASKKLKEFAAGLK
jgi:glyoxylase-like metal-dependent hydrolase (beta-lactamase superfamily II)